MHLLLCAPRRGLRDVNFWMVSKYVSLYLFKGVWLITWPIARSLRCSTSRIKSNTYRLVRTTVIIGFCCNFVDLSIHPTNLFENWNEGHSHSKHTHFFCENREVNDIIVFVFVKNYSFLFLFLFIMKNWRILVYSQFQKSWHVHVLRVDAELLLHSTRNHIHII